MADVANHVFLPYVQPGVAANIPDTSIDKLTAAQPSVINLQMRLVVNTDTVDKLRSCSRATSIHVAAISCLSAESPPLE